MMASGWAHICLFLYSCLFDLDAVQIYASISDSISDLAWPCSDSISDSNSSFTLEHASMRNAPCTGVRVLHHDLLWLARIREPRESEGMFMLMLALATAWLLN